MRKSLFALALSLSCSCSALAASLWNDAATPGTAAAADSNAVEIGVKFTAEVNGVITGIRFFKGVDNVGTHVAHLWTGSGTQLASATFVDETGSGWQQVNFATPVAINANTVYVASYHAPAGHYAADNNYFAASIDNPPLQAPANDASGGNGVFAYGPAGTFPNASWQSTNYWVDVVFETRATTTTDAPLLLLTSATNNFTQYYAEILRAEGLNAFTTADVTNLSRALLDQHDTVVLGEVALTTAQVATLTDWVDDGGNLIAMRPDKKLANLLGLTDQSSTLSEGYLKIAQNGPGRGIVAETIQYHGVADRYELNGAISIATLYSNANTVTASPAVTLRQVGSGYAVAFTYDLARSVVYTHQGNPEWVGRDSDGVAPVRTNDLFYPNYIDLDKVAIPQADEQQRLLANLITQVTLSEKPLPRFWYLPNGAKAAIIHALDDHATEVGGTRQTYNKFIAASPAGCSVADWECLRATSWAYANIDLSQAEAANYIAQGFELGVHARNQVDGLSCRNFDSFAQLNDNYNTDLTAFANAFPNVPPQQTHRYHCIIWSDWLTQAKVELAHGMRFSMDYYYWPLSWNGRTLTPGLFTGSGIPMRFADLDGTVIDVYQGVSHLVNETPLGYPAAINTMIDRAVGPEGYYGFFGTHDDYQESTFSDAVISAGVTRNVPVISALQALTWLDGRNASSFHDIAWNGNTLSFNIDVGAGARNLQAMLPLSSVSNELSSISHNGATVPFTVQTIKGVRYAFFAASEGVYQAVYNNPLQPPVAEGFTLWPANAAPNTPAFNDPSTVEVGVKFRSDVSGLITGIRFYKGAGNIGTHVGSLWSIDGARLASGAFLNETASGWQQLIFDTPVAISANTTYVASYHANNGNYAADSDYFLTEVINGPLHALADAQSPNGVYSYGPSSFPTLSHRATNYWVDVIFTLNPPRTLWKDTDVPATPSVDDPGEVEVGVKFFSETAGRIKGIRFYKGSSNTGTHTATLWNAAGAPLATATFTSETESGWQEVVFAEPVDIAANTTYVASYHAPNGRYA
ncbi:MAG: DUF4082 domain-containing protein, partial [Steroidobacter sp.]